MGPDYKLLLSQAYFLFLSYLAHTTEHNTGSAALSSPSSGSVAQRGGPSSTALMCILDLANLEYDAYDLRQLQQLNIPRFIYALSAFCGSNKLILQNPAALSELTRYGRLRMSAPWNVRFACFQLFRLMCTQAMHLQKSSHLDSDPTIHQLRSSVLSCLFTQLQTIWAQRPEAVCRLVLFALLLSHNVLACSISVRVQPRLNKPSDAALVWTCEDCSYTSTELTMFYIYDCCQ